MSIEKKVSTRDAKSNIEYVDSAREKTVTTVGYQYTMIELGGRVRQAFIWISLITSLVLVHGAVYRIFRKRHNHRRHLVLKFETRNNTSTFTTQLSIQYT